MATTANKNCKQFIGIVTGEDGITARSGDEPGKGTVKLQTAEINEDESTSSETVYQISETGSTDVEVYNYTEMAFAKDEEVEIWQDGYGVFYVTPIGKTKITPHLNSSSDEYPDGASRLDSLDTYLYCSSLDKINKKGTNNPPYVYNPLGLPLERPTVIAKVDGFPGSAEEPTSGNRHTGEYVAISNDTRDYFNVNPAGANWSGMNNNPDENGAPNDYFAKGNLYYIQAPLSGSGHYDVVEGAFGHYAVDMRLAVCQRDMPENWTTQFRMPYYTLEMNYGVKPNVSTATGETFVERCGVYPGENKLSNKRLDYHYSQGRYSYEPIFTYTGRAKGTVGSRLVYIEIEGNDYLCGTMQGGSSGGLSVPWGCYPPDIYPGDMITVQVDAREVTPVITIIQCPRDYPESAEIIANSYAVYGQRGWTDVTSEYTNQLGNNGVLVLGTGVSGINAHYSGDSTGAQIPQLYFIELGFKIWRKNKTNAIL